MKEFSVTVKCNDWRELRSALEQAAEEVSDNRDRIDELEVDEDMELDPGEAGGSVLFRVS